MKKVILSPATPHGEIRVPPSKSAAHRAILCAALSHGRSVVDYVDLSADILATLRGADALGASVRPHPGGVIIDGTHAFQPGHAEIHCGESGSTLRFLIPLSLVLRGGGRFTGRGRLMERPQEPYFRLFEEKHVCYSLEAGVLTVRGALPSGCYALPGNVSSQFITGLLYALPLLEGDSDILLTTPLESGGYVDMTLDVLERFGVRAVPNGSCAFHVPGGQTYRPHDMAIESDYSQAAFWYAARGLGSQVELQGLNPFSVQGDRCIVEDSASLCGPGEVELDVSQCPDLVPPLAVQAALRPGQTTRIVGAARLRMKESDRLSAVTQVLNALGSRVEEHPDSLTILGVDTLAGGVAVDSHNDHRIAMMAAVATTRAAAPVTIRGAESVRKSYPNFWEDYQRLGGMFL